MLLKPDQATANSSAAMLCGNCGAEERRLLHHVRHRGIFRRLCTTCVLRLHPQSFCPTCFQVYPPAPPNDAVLTCFKCYSASHSHCVAAPPSPYICPLCAHPTTPIFNLKSAKEANLRSDDYRVMDRDAAKKLLAAAKIASASMNKAAVASRAEAERRAKEAAFTRKRAKEALEHVAYLMMKEKLRKKEAALVAPGLGGVGNQVGYMGRGMKMEGVNGGNVRNGSVHGCVSGSSVAIDDKINTVGSVDNPNQVLAALNAVELRENGKIGAIAAQGEGLQVPLDDFRARENVGGLIGENNNESGSDLAMFADMGNGTEKPENVNNDVALVQPVADEIC